MPQGPARKLDKRPLGTTPGGRNFDRQAIPKTKADKFRKRAEVLGKRLRPSQVQKTSPMGRKQKALLDLADNEDWLNGVKAKKVQSAMPSSSSRRRRNDNGPAICGADHLQALDFKT
jgi:hypothetical protein